MTWQDRISTARIDGHFTDADIKLALVFGGSFCKAVMNNDIELAQKILTEAKKTEKITS